MFVPRSLLRVDTPAAPRRVKPRASQAASPPLQARLPPEPLTPAPASGVAEDIDTSADTGVKKRSYEQRYPADSEPVCTICGRYGEYVCDATEEDICSLECKAVALQRAGFSPQNVAEVLEALREETVEVPTASARLPEQIKDKGQEYIPDPQVESLRAELYISVRGESVPKPILDFKGCDFPPTLLDNLEQAGYDSPTPIQMQAIPIACQGTHLLASAPTGSGKTAAFLLPVLAHIGRLQSAARVQDCRPRVKNPISGVQDLLPPLLKHPLALILGPTRELCAQIEVQAQLLARGLPGVRTALVVGGNSLSQQMHRMDQGCQVIIATPGRLIDVLVRTGMALESVEILVMDEVDSMLELGFRDQVAQIMAALRSPQLLLFSATIPPETERFARKLLERPVYVAVGQPSVVPTSVRQAVIWVEEKDKKQKLFDILGAPRHFAPPAVVFVGSRQGADLLSQAVVQMTRVNALSLHADKSPSDRKAALEGFRAGEISVLVATSMMGRGLHLPNLNQVIVFDVPGSVEELLHQLGRVGRGGKAGRAIIFVNKGVGSKVLGQLAKMLRESGTYIPTELKNALESKIGHKGGPGGKGGLNDMGKKDLGFMGNSDEGMSGVVEGEGSLKGRGRGKRRRRE